MHRINWWKIDALIIFGALCSLPLFYYSIIKVDRGINLVGSLLIQAGGFCLLASAKLLLNKVGKEGERYE